MGTSDLVIGGGWEFDDQTAEPLWVWCFNSGRQSKVAAIQVACDSTDCAGLSMEHSVGRLQHRCEDIHQTLLLKQSFLLRKRKEIKKSNSQPSSLRYTSDR